MSYSITEMASLIGPIMLVITPKWEELKSQKINRYYGAWDFFKGDSVLIPKSSIAYLDKLFRLSFAHLKVPPMSVSNLSF